MNKQDLINKLPTEWSQITLNQYINLINDLPLTDNPSEDTLNEIVAIWFYHFTGIPMYEADLNAIEVMQVIDKMNQFNADADKPKMDLSDKIKSIDEIKYNEFISLIKLQSANTFLAYPAMINLMLKEPIENIGNKMDMATANSFFLQLNLRLEEYINNSLSYLIMNQKKK